MKVSINGECVGFQSEKLKFVGNLKEYLEWFSPYVSYKGECIERKKYMRKLWCLMRWLTDNDTCVQCWNITVKRKMFNK